MPNDTRSWKTRQITHEGFPLFLRYPENGDFDSRKSKFPILVVITHEFANVLPNGLPEPDYNDGLLQFDSDIRAEFEEGEKGQTVLIETFGGKRKYYIYLMSESQVDEKIASVAKRYPSERLAWSVHSDAEWNFIRQYTKEFLGREAD